MATRSEICRTFGIRGPEARIDAPRSASKRRAIARTVAAAREICTDDYGFSMPEMIFVNVHLKPDAKSGLFNDGNDTFVLTIRNHEDLLKPAAIAETFWFLAHQDPSAWTHEIDVRPFKENF